MPGEEGRGPGAGRKLGRIGLALVLPVLLIVAWQFAAVRLNNPWLLPRVPVVLDRLLHPFENVLETGSLVYNVAVSCVRVLLGFTLGALVAVPLGLVMGRVRLVRRVVGPFVEMFRPLCPIAWIPFAMAVFRTWTVVNVFGVRYSDTILDTVQVGMLFILFYGAFFPILLNTVDGVLGVRDTWIESALTLGARPGQVFRKVVLPAALPSV
ncbi:ABC transporter permease subunit, partial [candidate division WOR-3 bacterium]|nr:ABC transporter permease subunit [candidate division WOR-3 bacterium]